MSDAPELTTEEAMVVRLRLMNRGEPAWRVGLHDGFYGLKYQNHYEDPDRHAGYHVGWIAGGHAARMGDSLLFEYLAGQPIP